MSLSKVYYYHGLTRKYVSTFGELFTDIFVERKDGDENTRHRERVPLTYAPKEKFIQRIFQEKYKEKDFKVAMKLPRMAFEISGFSYSPERKLTSKRKSKYDINPTLRYYHWNPVPYDINFELYIAAKTQEEGLQIVEQILPYFTPDYVIAANLLGSDVDSSFDIPISLVSVTSDDPYDGSFEDRRMITWELSFVAKAWFIGRLHKQGVIEHAIVNTFTGTFKGEKERKALYDHIPLDNIVHEEDDMDALTKHICRANATVTINHFGEDNSAADDEEGVLPDGTLFMIQGSSFDYLLEVQNEDGTDFNLSGWEVSSQMRVTYDSDVAYDFTAEITNANTGKVRLSMNSEQTQDIPPGYYVFDVELENNEGYVLNVADGVVYVKPQITR